MNVNEENKKRKIGLLPFLKALVSPQTLLSKRVLLAALIVFNAIFAIYCLTFITDFWMINIDEKNQMITDFLYWAHYYNIQLSTYAVYGFVLIVVSFLFRSYQRKVWYWTNLLILTILAVFYLYLGIYILSSSLALKTDFLAIDYTYVQQPHRWPNFKADPRPFDLGVILAIGFFIMAAWIIAMVIPNTLIYLKKTKEYRQNRHILFNKQGEERGQ